MPKRLRRWTWLLVLPVVLGALLLVHGLDAHAGCSHPAEPAAAAPVAADHAHDEPMPADHGHCTDCLVGHVVAACVAIISAVGGLGQARRLLGRGSLAAPVAAIAGRIGRLVELARPSEPVWVRLSVMNC